MNRRGDIFMVCITVFFLVALVLIFWKLAAAFRPAQADEGLGTRQVALLQAYASSERMLLYIDTAARFAALDAASELLANGAVPPVASGCGQYAGAESWTAPGDKTCFPDRPAALAAYGQHFKDGLRRWLRYPGMPPVEYEIKVEGGLRITGTALDEITLPIVAAKDAMQQQAAGIAQEAAVLGSRAQEDSPLARLALSGTGSPRAGKAVRIIIHAANAPTEDARYAYSRGLRGVHYLIGTGGEVLQLTQEDMACAGCPDDSIEIALAGPAQCWTGYAQYGTLERLAADIAARRNMAPEQVAFAAGLCPEQGQVLADLVVAVAEGKGQPPPGRQQQSVSLAVTLPTESNVITSCWGPRVIGDGFHDGLDFRAQRAPVFAFTDGEVHETCEGHCGGYGTYVILKHSETLFTQYNHLSDLDVAKGDAVARGERIGTSGNTGASQAPHLDFKVYTAPSDLPGQRPAGPQREYGKNPLCFFPEEMLRELEAKSGSDCRRYSANGLPGLTHDNPVLAAECRGITPLSDAPVCGFNTVAVSANGNKDLELTIGNLQRAGVLDRLGAIVQEERLQEAGGDAALVIAVMAQESKGVPDAVSATGCLGLGQICMGTAQAYPDIFGGSFTRCLCSRAGKAGRSCTAAEAGCAADPRRDPQKNVRGTVRILKSKIEFFRGKTDQLRLGIAAYNGGEGHVSAAIKKTGKRDPTWEEVAPYVREETRNYVPKVMAYYAAQGGATVGVFSDQRCEEIKVKEIGRYTFTPSFTTEIPDPLGPLAGVTDFARSTYDACTGQTDARACLGGRLDGFSVDGARIAACGSPAEVLAGELAQFIADCRANGQQGCGCQWNPRPADTDVRLRLYGDEAQWLAGDAAGPVPAGASEGVELFIGKDGTRLLSRWNMTPDEEGREAQPYSALISEEEVRYFTLSKEGERLSWAEDAEKACGIYKTQHHVCVEFDKPIDGERPLLRFSLFLNDVHPPQPVGSLCAVAASQYGLAGAAFSPSPSDDVSYYNVSCMPAGGIVPGGSVIVQGRRFAGYADLPLSEQQQVGLTLDDCGGIPSAQYEVTVTPYDISGNAGTPVTKVTEEAGGSGVTDLATLFAAMASCADP